MSETNPKKSNKWFWLAWITLIAIVAITIALPFVSFGIMRACNISDVERGTTFICDNAWVLGLAGFVWLPYVLALSAGAAILLLIIQKVSNRSPKDE